MISWFIILFGIYTKIFSSRPTVWCHLASMVKCLPQPWPRGQTSNFWPLPQHWSLPRPFGLGLEAKCLAASGLEAIVLALRGLVTKIVASALA